MNRAVDKTTLGYLGPDFQYKLVKCFMEEPGYFASIYSVIEQNAFTESLLKRYVGTLKDYYSERGIVPSYETMSIMLKQKARMENEVEEWDELTKNLKELSPEGTSVIEESATKFFKQQNMIKVANDILKKTQDGDTDHYEECLKMMEDAVHVGNEDDNGFNPYDVVDEVMREGSEVPIPTGIKELDETLNGGLFKGHIGLVLGPSGFGKTTFSTAVASYASTFRCDLNNNNGWKTLQFCFEDDVKSIAKKHFSRITQIEAKDLTKHNTIDEARLLIDTYEEKELFRENLIIKKYKTGTKSVDDLKLYIKQLINNGFRPDLIILDYFECLKLIRKDRNETKWDLQESAMRQLEVLAEEFNVALWIMTQGNKDSFAAEIVKMEQAGGSITKVQIGHVIISIARSLDDIDNNRALIAMLKNRQGKSGTKYKVMFYNGTSTITCELVDEWDSEFDYQEDTKRLEEEARNNATRKVLEKQRLDREYEAMHSVTVKEHTPAPQQPIVDVPEETIIEPEPVHEETKKVEPPKPEAKDVPIAKPVTDNGAFKLQVIQKEEVKKPDLKPQYHYIEETVDDELAIHIDELEAEFGSTENNDF